MIDWLIDIPISGIDEAHYIGPRHRAACAPIYCSSGVSLPWVEELRYLGIFITR